MATSKARAAAALAAAGRPSDRLGCLFGAAVMGMMFVGAMGGSSFLLGAGELMAGALVLSRIVEDLRSGVSSSNWGTWRRDESRVGFHRNTIFWAVVATLWFLLGFATMLGFVSWPLA
jgi:hypothetical protein